MAGTLVALILLSTLSLVQTSEFDHQTSLTVAEHGDNLTLTCLGIEYGMFYWFKMDFGYMAGSIVRGSFDRVTLEKSFDKRKFMVEKVGNVYSLTITNVSKEDEAVYFCQTGSSYEIMIRNVTVLAVNDPKTKQKSVYVKQSPNMKSVPLGDTVNLQCSLFSGNKENTDQCPGNHSVYWFRAGSGSYPGIIYTDRSSGEEQEDRRCDYRLPKTIRGSADTGTYYCAVVTCGQILLGEGTTVATKTFCPIVIVLTLLAVSVLVNFCLLLTIMQKKPVCPCCTGEVTTSNFVEQDRAAELQQSDREGEAAGINYVALDFQSRKANKWKDRRETHGCNSECLYSDMKDCQ
ncbi:uncharacterized protein LOC114443024 [Parambassis ranga]|uniref:Uncharacterized protein LOC114443024 n=1 Tax=Parambassis ranga TaxID=210632 RepID=A0A6P7J802_9TELE|nr:uncharacterized protein LOC114443024 [Parambassis ranga]